MKLVSWNVNGIRAVLKKGFVDILKDLNPDIFCIQETRAPKDGMEIDINGYEQIWNNAVKPGYSGTLVLTKKPPLSSTHGMGVAKHDSEGRLQTCEYKEYFLVNVYVPNAKRGLERLPYRHKEWDPDLLKYLKKLEKKKPVIFCGDLNVAHTEIDLANPKGNQKTHGFTREEREGFQNFIDAGFVDTFREFEKGEGHYTWWSQMGNCRARNVGWRIDYFLVSSSLKKRLKKAKILNEIMGSDHCPVMLEVK